MNSHQEKAPFPSFSSVAGSLTEVSPVPEKAYAPISFKLPLSAKLTEDSFELPENAFAAMTSTEAGTVKETAFCPTRISVFLSSPR